MPGYGFDSGTDPTHTLEKCLQPQNIENGTQYH